MYLQIEKNSGFHLVHCFPKSLIMSRKYHHFTNRTANQMWHVGLSAHMRDVFSSL